MCHPSPKKKSQAFELFLSPAFGISREIAMSPTCETAFVPNVISAPRKAGRPRVGLGVKVISVSIEKELLAHTDNLARQLNLSRAALISEGLRRMAAEHAAQYFP